MNQYSRQGYWFAATNTLSNGDGRKIVIGESLSVDLPLNLCSHGLHYSSHPADALKYAKGFLLYKVEALGEIKNDYDKACTNIRKHLDVKDATNIVLLWSRECAKSCLNLWDAPKVVQHFLKTGEEAAEAAEAAARAARAVWATAAAAEAARAAAEAAEAARATAWAAEAAKAAKAAKAAAWATAWAAWAAKAARATEDAARATEDAARAARAARAAAKSDNKEKLQHLVDKLFAN